MVSDYSILTSHGTRRHDDAQDVPGDQHALPGLYRHSSSRSAGARRLHGMRAVTASPCPTRGWSPFARSNIVTVSFMCHSTIDQVCACETGKSLSVDLLQMLVFLPPTLQRRCKCIAPPRSYCRLSMQRNPYFDGDWEVFDVSMYSLHRQRNFQMALTGNSRYQISLTVMVYQPLKTVKATKR